MDNRLRQEAEKRRADRVSKADMACAGTLQHERGWLGMRVEVQVVGTHESFAGSGWTERGCVNGFVEQHAVARAKVQLWASASATGTVHEQLQQCDTARTLTCDDAAVQGSEGFAVRPKSVSSDMDALAMGRSCPNIGVTNGSAASVGVCCLKCISQPT